MIPHQIIEKETNAKKKISFIASHYGKYVFITLVVFQSIASLGQFPYQNPALSPGQRAEDLVHRLTLEEKVSLMMNASVAIPRLGIRKYEWWNEALHGVARNGKATVFPQAIGMAASFDEELLKQVFSAVSDEARIKNRIARESGKFNRYQGLTMWTPNINIFRDPRWGRGQETYGEDPFLTSTMGVAVIAGLQGDKTDGYDKLHACAKHYAVHSGPEWNRHSYNASNISLRDLWETYLPAFKDAVQKAHVKEVMCAYNRFEGEPCCGSDRLLVQILRQKWGFDGIVLSDCGAIDNFYKKGAHMTHPDSASASADAVISGTDLECGSSYQSLESAVKKGLITHEQINTSLYRLLKARFELGEMDGCSPWDSLPDSLVNCTSHRLLALKMAHESIVLLQNNGILPLAPTKKIALLGPNAHDSIMQWGNYNGIPYNTVTLFEALQTQLPHSEIIFEPLGDHTGTRINLFNECSIHNREGFEVKYWNNTDMQGNPDAVSQIHNAIKVGKRDTFEAGIRQSNIALNYHSLFKPTQSGDVEFVFTTSAEVHLKINGREVSMVNIPKAIQVYQMHAEQGKEYTIDVDVIKRNQGEFHFNLVRVKETNIPELLAKLNDVDVVIYAGGITANLECEEANVYAPGFAGGDRTSIELPQIQRDVIDALKSAGKKLILVNFSGSAMGLSQESKNCDAMLQAWYPGEAGGTAVADVLLGKYNPAGRLPVTFYQHTSQLPDFEDYHMKGRTYRFLKEPPLFAFGHGLSYTHFDYGKPKLSRAKIKPGESVRLIVPVTNTGKTDGEEVVQVYLKKLNDPDGPIKTLRAFKRMAIPAGSTFNAEFLLTKENLEWWDSITQSVGPVEGNFQILVGKSSKDSDLIPVDLKIVH